ncbi:MAG TPA: L-histidine N(alpha)-methyltransferase [Acidimicrobiales bacterium]|nr:L-histidine N(alpha)-methyltransferase [Acidimicrobiales bacterium]
MTSPANVRVDVHLDPEQLRAALRTEARAGLTASPKELSPKWFYDERGCELFEAITGLPEYYPTRREQEILDEHARSIAELTGADTVVELGSGTSAKTRTLLDAFVGRGHLEQFVAFDLSEPTLRAAAASIAEEYPGVAVHAVVGDFDHHLGELAGGGRRLIAFLGGTIGNLGPDRRASFLKELASSLGPRDTFLLGTDLVKDVARLEAAYDDRAGVTAMFNLNVLAVLNRELGADFDLERFEHVARFDREQEWIEMLLRSTADQVVTLADLDLTISFEAGEEMRTEISAKFRRSDLEAEMQAAGLELAHWWTDEAGDFALSLWTPIGADVRRSHSP